MTNRLTPALAGELAQIALAVMHREYPNKPSRVLTSDADNRAPRHLAPIFYGCFDWHSAVHTHWTLARLLRRMPSAPWATDVRTALAHSFTPEKVAGELASLTAHPGYELPYGIAWLLQLATELDGAHQDTLRPLEELAATRLAHWLDRLSHPIRTGEHSQSAFAMGLALDWARHRGEQAYEDHLTARALALYEADRAGPLHYEPSAHDFLSPCLAEADLLARILPPERLATWLTEFLPHLELEPVVAVDRADGKLAHFDGLNLSRAWMLARLGRALPDHDPRCALLAALAARHGAAGLAAIGVHHYAVSHWLGSFALYWLTVF